MRILFAVGALASLLSSRMFMPTAAPAPQSPPARTTTTMPKPRLAPKITPFLWFVDDAEEAVRFYCSVFADSKVIGETRWGDGGPVKKGTLMTARFTLGDREFVALNGGEHHRFNESISFVVDCATQAEIDYYWAKLTANGGRESMCGWLQDKYGLSWQIVPGNLGDLLSDQDPERAARVSKVMLAMQKLDLARLQAAAAGR